VSRFEFTTPTRVVFGPGAVEDAGRLARELGHHALVVTGRHVARAEPLIDRLRRHDVLVTTCAVDGEPDIDVVSRGAARAREVRCDCVVGFGGGSALDAAKAIAVLTTNGGEALDYLEVVGRGQPLSHAGLPCMAVPTTAGTGSEVTRNAVLASPHHRVKASLRSPLMFPRIALVDADLAMDLPAAITATTGLDALTQLIEAYLSSRANPVTDALCLDGIRRAAVALPRAVADGRDRGAREAMSLAALLSGIVLTNAGLGAVHGFAGPIGGMFDAPHGAICAALLPHVMEANLRAVEARGSDATVARFRDLARCLTQDEESSAERGVRWLHDLVRELGIPALSGYGVRTDDFPAIVQAAQRASSMKGNPVPLTFEELSGILAGASGSRA
jgi:alcohol dehydrogenase class IV